MTDARPRTAGLTAAACYRVELADDTAAFAKVAVDQRTAADVTAEVRFYESVAAPFLAGLRGHGETDGVPVLLLEDLGEDGWPPPWPADLAPLWQALDQIAGTQPPPHLVPVAGRPGRWQAVAVDPTPLIRAGFFTAPWLVDALPALVAAEGAAPIAGDHLVHGDLWYSNLCFTPAGVKVVDWASAARGHQAIDAASLTLEMRIAGLAAPPFPYEAEHAALLAGGFARQLVEGAPDGVDADRLDEELREALGPALRWAAEKLGLPAPG